MTTLAWVLAVILAVLGIVTLLEGRVLVGILLLVAACLIGPGGYSLLR